MVLERTTFGFQRSYKEGFGFKYQNTLFVLKLSKALLHTQTEVSLHKLRMVCIHLKGVIRRKFMFDEGIGNKFGSYMSNEHLFKTTSYNNCKEYKVRIE